MADTIVCVNQLVVRYGSFVAVNSLSLSLRRGELFGLLGPNGAGKSTTLRVLIGQRPPTSGTVLVAGFDVVRHWQNVKPLFGYVPDHENHFDDFTAWQNLKFFAELYGVNDQRISECLDLVELQESRNLPVKSHSLGMRRKLLLARALLHRPQLLYLDEPTANLDVHSREVVHRILRNLVNEGTTVLLTTHDMVEVEQICDRVAILCRGQLVALDSPLALRSQHCERYVDVTTNDGQRRVLNLDLFEHRDRLSEWIRSGVVVAMQTREFDFHDAFLKLTGTSFDEPAMPGVTPCDGAS